MYWSSHEEVVKDKGGGGEPIIGDRRHRSSTRNPKSGKLGCIMALRQVDGVDMAHSFRDGCRSMQ